MRIAFLTPDLSDNSLGRTYCLWLLCRELGWEVRTFSSRGQEVWAPLRGTAFAATCEIQPTDDLSDAVFAWRPDLLIPVKAHPHSFGIALAVAARTGIPMILDYDDPDIEAVLAWSWTGFPKRLGRELLRRDQLRQYRALARAVPTVPTIVSNPTLQARWGGVVIPHVRPSRREGRTRTGNRRLPGSGARQSITVAFVGTARRHKGIGELRRAVWALRGDGYRLVVTAPPPRRPRDGEQWIGYTTIEAGRQVLEESDIVAIPSRRTVFASGQLPAKLIDAMMAGCAVVASDLPPTRWAGGGCVLYSRPGSWRDLRRRLLSLSDVSARRRLGDSANTRADQTFTPAAWVSEFEGVCRRAVASADESKVQRDE